MDKVTASWFAFMLTGLDEIARRPLMQYDEETHTILFIEVFDTQAEAQAAWDNSFDKSYSEHWYIQETAIAGLWVFVKRY